jgi:tight adherence protein C
MDWITRLLDWFATLGGDPEQLRLFYSIAFGVSAFVLMLALYLLFSGLVNPLRKRVHAVKETGVANPILVHAELKAAKEKEPNLLLKLLVPKDENKRSRFESLLRYANLRSDGAIRIFYGIKFAGLLVAPLLVFVLVGLTRVLPMNETLLFMLVIGTLGFILPNLILEKLARRHQEKLRRGLPDAMDLLVVCTEAGLRLGSAIQRVSTELSITHPDLADELGLFSLQTRAGMDNRAALRDLEARTGLEDIQSLVAMLLQSMRFGTSIADTLRIFADEMRDKRLQRAQEKAARISTLMIFPLALCVMPSFFLVVLGPPLLNAVRVMSGLE